MIEREGFDVLAFAVLVQMSMRFCRATVLNILRGVFAFISGETRPETQHGFHHC